MIIFIYGDSIAQGAWDTKDGWANRIKTYLINDAIKSNFKRYSQAINLGVDGDTTKKLLDRFNAETQARVWPNAENALIFAIGINDTMVANDKNISNAEDYKSELRSLLNQALQYANKIAFVNLTPVDEPSLNVVINPANHQCFYNSRIDEFNNVLKKFCEQHNLSLIDINSAFKTQDHKNLLADGIHPNTAGHEIIYDTVLPIVQKWVS